MYYSSIRKKVPLIYKARIVDFIVCCAVGLLFISSAACAQDVQSVTAQDAKSQTAIPESEKAKSGTASEEKWRGGRIEIKRQNTSRGTPEESTKTTFRLEGYFKGTVSLLRLDIPFPDEETDFNGSPFDPHLGDIKLRVGFRSFEAYSRFFSSFIEVTFPTANPESLGSGKYQLCAAINTSITLESLTSKAQSRQARFLAQIKQTNSIGGDQEREDINYTSFEFNLYVTWQKKYRLKLDLKPTVDWDQDGQTGAVSEIEWRVTFAHDWQTWLMLGARVWGPAGIPGTYNDRIEIGVARNFK